MDFATSPEQQALLATVRAACARFDDDSWLETPLTGGNHYFGHMVSEGVVQAGDTFFVGVGTRSNDLSRANDETVHSRSQFQWFIRAVEVRMATF